MRSSTRYSTSWLILPVLFAGILLLVMALVVGSAQGQEAESRESGDAMEEAEEESARVPDEDEEDAEGYGYVEAVPEAAARPPSPEEREEAIEGALLAARLGSGWGEEDLLAEDLRMLISAAQSQISIYQRELERLAEEGGSPEEVSDARRRLSDAEERLESFQSAATSLRASMLDLESAFERLDEASEER